MKTVAEGCKCRLQMISETSEKSNLNVLVLKKINEDLLAVLSISLVCNSWITKNNSLPYLMLLAIHQNHDFLQTYLSVIFLSNTQFIMKSRDQSVNNRFSSFSFHVRYLIPWNAEILFWKNRVNTRRIQNRDGKQGWINLRVPDSDLRNWSSFPPILTPKSYPFLPKESLWIYFLEKILNEKVEDFQEKNVSFEWFSRENPRNSFNLSNVLPSSISLPRNHHEWYRHWFEPLHFSFEVLNLKKNPPLLPIKIVTYFNCMPLQKVPVVCYYYRHLREKEAKIHPYVHNYVP